MPNSLNPYRQPIGETLPHWDAYVKAAPRVRVVVPPVTTSLPKIGQTESLFKTLESMKKENG